MKKTVIITGAAGNLGQAVTGRLLQEGYHINALISPQDNPTFNEDPEVETYNFDLTDENAANQIVQEIVTTRKQIDLAVMLVGGFSIGNIRNTDRAGLLHMYQLNFATAYDVARPVFLQMEKQSNGGQLIFIGSRPALVPAEGKDTLAYSLTKSLLFRLAEIINEEGEGKNITATVVVPSVIDTPGARAAMPQANFSDWVTPDDIAEDIAFVCSKTGKKLRQTVLKVYNNA